MIPQETVNRILDAAQIVDVVGDFVTLKKRGANHMACCPFHNEKTPSFVVSPSKGIFKCFGCGKSGTAVGFVMEHENLSYTEALKYLAKKYHIEVVEKEETAEEIAEKVALLDSILSANILSLFSGFGYHSGQKSRASILEIVSSRTVRYKDTEMLSFDIRFKCNANLPELCGLGKGASRGFGVIHTSHPRRK